MCFWELTAYRYTLYAVKLFVYKELFSFWILVSLSLLPEFFSLFLSLVFFSHCHASSFYHKTLLRGAERERSGQLWDAALGFQWPLSQCTQCVYTWSVCPQILPWGFNEPGLDAAAQPVPWFLPGPTLPRGSGPSSVPVPPLSAFLLMTPGGFKT